MFLKRRNQNVSSTSAILNVYSQNPRTFFGLIRFKITNIFLFRILTEIYKVSLQLGTLF